MIQNQSIRQKKEQWANLASGRKGRRRPIRLRANLRSVPSPQPFLRKRLGLRQASLRRLSRPLRLLCANKGLLPSVSVTPHSTLETERADRRIPCPPATHTHILYQHSRMYIPRHTFGGFWNPIQSNQNNSPLGREVGITIE